MFEAEDLLNLFRVKEEEESTVKVAQSHVFKTIFDFGGPSNFFIIFFKSCAIYSPYPKLLDSRFSDQI